MLVTSSSVAETVSFNYGDVEAAYEKQLKRVRNIYTWGDKLHIVPAVVEIKGMSLEALWRCWWNDTSVGVLQRPPYKLLVGHDFTVAANYRKARACITAIVAALETGSKFKRKQSISALTATEQEDLLQEGSMEVMGAYDAERRRLLPKSRQRKHANVVSLSFLTFYEYTNMTALQAEARKAAQKGSRDSSSDSSDSE
jgi:hypothetical protein